MPAESRHSSTQGPFISSCSVFCSMTWKWQYLQIHKVMWRFITCSFSPLVVYSPLVDHESEGSLPGKESGGCRGWIGADISQGSPSTNEFCPGDQCSLSSSGTQAVNSPGRSHPQGNSNLNFHPFLYLKSADKDFSAYWVGVSRRSPGIICVPLKLISLPVHNL